MKKNINIFQTYNGICILDKPILNNYGPLSDSWCKLFSIINLDILSIRENISRNIRLARMNGKSISFEQFQYTVNNIALNIIIEMNKAILESHKYQYHIKNKTNHARYNYHELDKIDIDKAIDKLKQMCSRRPINKEINDLADCLNELSLSDVNDSFEIVKMILNKFNENK